VAIGVSYVLWRAALGVSYVLWRAALGVSYVLWWAARGVIVVNWWVARGVSFFRIPKTGVSGVPAYRFGASWAVLGRGIGWTGG